MVKKYFYIGAFGFLGWLLSMLVHAGIEIPTLGWITGEVGHYGDNWVWRHWSVLHGTVGLLLSLSGVVLGLLLGQRFWQILYVEKRYGTPRW